MLGGYESFSLRRKSRVKPFVRAGAVVALAMLLHAIITAVAVFSVRVDSASMEPALARGERVLATPLAFGVTAALGRKPFRWIPLAGALLVSAALHGASDLSLVLPDVGRLGYALALAAPALVLFESTRSRRRREIERVRSTRGPCRAPGATAPWPTGGRPVSRQGETCSHLGPSSTPGEPAPHPGPTPASLTPVGPMTAEIR